MNRVYKIERDILKEDIKKCTDEQQLLFKRMYSCGRLDKEIEKVIDDMPDDKLGWAICQVGRTLAKETK